jgi:cation:H+ antiporter
VTLVGLAFGACLAAILVAGVHLSRAADVIADKTGFSRSWIGLVLLATVTSLPELVTTLSAVTLAHVPDIALGDVLGSCVFNLMLIAILDFLQRGESVLTRASQGHLLSAGFGVIMIGFVGLNILLAREGATPALGHVGLASPILLGLYLVAMRSVYRYERRTRVVHTAEAAELYPELTLHRAVVRYLLAALVIVAAGTALPFVGDQLAAVMGWRRSFVGTLFVALATSAPEVVVTVTALRLGTLDMAIGNLLGSNLFDTAIVAIGDCAFLPGPILAHVSPVHVVSATSAVIMTGVAIVGLVYRAPGHLFRAVGWASLLLVVLFVLNSYVLYLFGH